MRTTIYAILFFMMLSISGHAQQFLTGKLFKKESTEFLVSVSIHNLTHQHYDLSEENGSYRIQAMPGDRVVFTMIGFRADTLTVTGEMLSGDYPIYLEPQ
ncbi:MAG: hypothetical protein ABUM51_10300, partial [Bacteroidota bacterium]